MNKCSEETFAIIHQLVSCVQSKICGLSEEILLQTVSGISPGRHVPLTSHQPQKRFFKCVIKCEFFHYLRLVYIHETLFETLKIVCDILLDSWPFCNEFGPPRALSKQAPIALSLSTLFNQQPGQKCVRMDTRAHPRLMRQPTTTTNAFWSGVLTP